MTDRILPIAAVGILVGDGWREIGVLDGVHVLDDPERCLHLEVRYGHDNIFAIVRSNSFSPGTPRRKYATGPVIHADFKAARAYAAGIAEDLKLLGEHGVEYMSVDLHRRTQGHSAKGKVVKGHIARFSFRKSR